MVALLLSVALLPAVWAVGPGGDITVEDGCEEFVAHNSEDYNKTGEEVIESYEILSVNFLEVASPLVLSIWILVAAVAKISKFHQPVLLLCGSNSKF